MLAPLLQLAQAAAMSRRRVFGTGVTLVPLRHPTPVAKQASTLDRLTEGQFIFGVGVRGEFHKELEACGVPITERGARLDEIISVIRRLWSGTPATHDGRFFKCEGVTMQPPPTPVVSSTVASGHPICCSHAWMTPTQRRSMLRPLPSASAMGWTSARPPSVIARSARRKGS